MSEERRWLWTAAEIAKGSLDKSTQNGAVLVDTRGLLISGGANNIPRLLVKRERLDRPLKYSYTAHAERAAIYHAALCGSPTWASTLYCLWFACDQCALAIIEAGIKKVVGLESYRQRRPDHWKASIEMADSMLDEAGVERACVDAHLGVKLRFNGEIIEV
jgi:dCMP deaminase